MPRIDLSFLLLAAASLLVGVTLGIGMGVIHDFQLAPVHAHLNLVGWASLALFGLTYRAYPELGCSRLASIHFALASLGAVLFPIGIALAITEVTSAVAIAAAFVWLGAVLSFLANLARVAMASSRTAVVGPAK